MMPAADRFLVWNIGHDAHFRKTVMMEQSPLAESEIIACIGRGNDNLLRDLHDVEARTGSVGARPVAAA
jgi:hypothetical protein